MNKVELSSMLNLPRGAFKGKEQAALSSAEWSPPNVQSQWAYRGQGALFIGAMPYEDIWLKLLDLQDKVGQLQSKLQSDIKNPVQYAEAIKRLEKIWMSGMLADCMPLGLNDDRHFVTIAGARSGKGQSAIIPNLCLYQGSVVCLDPKGENASITAARRGQGDEWSKGIGQKVYVLDPFGVADVPEDLRASFNPFHLLDKDSPLVVDDAALIAEGLILTGGDGEAHWTDTARNLVKGLILYMLDSMESPTLFDLRRLLTIGDKEGYEAAAKIRADYLREYEAAETAHKVAIKKDPFIDFEPPQEPEELMPNDVRNPFEFVLWRMEKSEAFGGVIAGTAESILGTGSNERGSTLSTARRHTAFLDTLGERFKQTLSGAGRTFSPDELKADPKGVTVYLCLPAERMGTHGRWLRLMVGMFLERMQRQLIDPASGVPVLFLLEEFFALGSMPSIEKAAGYAAGFGVKLWAILQDLQQLKSLYPSSWQTFLANAGAVQIFGASDKDTLDYASQALGEIEISRVTVSLSKNTSQGENKGSDANRMSPALHPAAMKNLPMTAAQLFLRGIVSDVSTSSNTAISENHNTALHVVPLLRPDEIARHFARESGASLMLIKGERPMWCLRVNYNDAPWFQGLFTPLRKYQTHHKAGVEPWSLWARPPNPFGAVAAAFNELGSQY